MTSRLPESPTLLITPPEIALSLEGVTVNLGGKTVLHEVSLEVKKGEFVALIGASGGGKSTLLRVMAALVRPSSGRVFIAEAPAFVFQDYRLLPWRTALGNVRLPGQLGRGGLEPLEALHQTGMRDFAHLYPHQLSGGMRARVAVARALAQSGDIVLMDEPFAALDALVRERFNAELRHLHEKSGRTTVFVTHSIREAVYLADRVAVLKDGQIREVLDTSSEGRVTAYTDGLEAHLRSLLGMGDSTQILPPGPVRRIRWEGWASLGLFGLLLLAWQYGSSTLPYLFPPPLSVGRELLENAGFYAGALGVTLETTVLGFLLGGVVGTVLGYLLGRVPALERVLSPFLVATQSTPLAVLTPIFILAFGFGLFPAVIATALTAFYPMLVATMVGVREVGRDYRELFLTLRANFGQRLRLLELPGALPSLLGGMRLGISLALIGAVVWEFVVSDVRLKGLGFLIREASTKSENARVYAGVLLLALLGSLLYAGVGLLERYALRHRKK